MKLMFSTVILLITALQVHVTSSTEELYGASHEDRRQILVKDIIKKITNFALYSFYNTTLEERPQILIKMRNKLKLASKFTGSRSDKYVQLVMDGIHSIIASKEISDIQSGIETNAINSIDHQHHQHIKEDEPSPERKTELRVATSFNENSYLSDELEPVDKITVHRNDTCDCSCVEGKLCSKILSLGKFTCQKDRNIISLKKLCNGEYNCNDNSDEERCRIHANKKLKDAKRIIKEIKHILPKHCLEVQSSSDKVVEKTQEQVLAKVLKKQLTLLNIVAPIKYQNINDKSIKEVSEIALLVSSVGAALEGAFCIRDKYKKVFYRRDGTSIDEDGDFIITQRRLWLPPLCICFDQFCGQSNCSTACNNTCWQRYSLGQYVCQAVSGARSVSLNLLCDGKIDCLDESDEEGCTAGTGARKFEAIQAYNIILEVLSTKTAAAEYHPLLLKFFNLKEAVRSLQAQSIIEETDMPTVKRRRDEVISGILSIYEAILVKAGSISEVDSEYNFLMSVNRKLVDAMKLSKTGNVRLMPPNECHCVGDKCMLAECSKACVRSCAVKPAITEYSCRGDSGKTTPIQNICNGQGDCPEGDDEEKCTKDVCRNHHLMVLRNKIQDYKEHRWGHVFGAIFDNWKTRTVLTIRAIEKMNRTNRRDLQKLIAETLYDLVQTYASLPKITRRSTESILVAFLELSRRIQDTLRDCTK